MVALLSAQVSTSCSFLPEAQKHLERVGGVPAEKEVSKEGRQEGGRKRGKEGEREGGRRRLHWSFEAAVMFPETVRI